MLRLSGQALVISFLSYGFGVKGSGMAEDHLEKIDTSVLNILARRVVGVGPSARSPAFHAMAGLSAERNLFIQHSGEMLNRCLIASGSSVRRCVCKKLCEAYGTFSWNATPKSLVPPTALGVQIGRLKYLDYDVAATWIFQMLPGRPLLLTRMQVQSAFHSDAWGN